MKAVLINDTRVDRHHGCSTVYRAIEHLSRAHGIDIIETAPAHFDWRLNQKVMDALSRADVVIVNGEGTIHHDRPAGGWLLAAGEWAAKHGKPAALINATWQQNSPELVSKLRNFAVISVRESGSESELKALGVACARMPDLALYFDWPAVETRVGVGFTDSVIGKCALALERKRRSCKGGLLNIRYGDSGFVTGLRAVRRYLSRSDLVRPLNVVDAIRAASDGHGAQNPDTSAFVLSIAGSKLLVSGRFHALILAMATRTPFLVIDSNTHKIGATVRDAGLAPWRLVRVGDIDDNLVAKASQWSDDECELLDKFLIEGREKMRALFLGISKLATPHRSK